MGILKLRQNTGLHNREIMMKPKERKALIARLNAIQNLLGGFGATPVAFDPGVRAFGDNGLTNIQINFDGSTWEWVRPLLEELRDFRKDADRQIKEYKKEKKRSQWAPPQDF
jgi:hypothetical protein